MVATPSITISTTCHKQSPFRVAFSASKFESSISKPTLSIGRTALLPAMSSLPVLTGLPPLSSQSSAKPQFKEPQHGHNGKHPDTLNILFGALLDNPPDATHCMAIYRGTWEYIKHISEKEMHTSDARLHPMERYIYHGTKVPVEGVEGEPISLICRCTESQSWPGWDRRNYCVWVLQRLGRCCGVLNGHLPWQLQRLFKIKLLNEDGAFVEYLLALELTTLPEHLDNLNSASKSEWLRQALAAVAFQGSGVLNIVGCVDVIPEIATNEKTGDGRNEWWNVNCHIDLATWNDVYN